MPPFAVIR